MTPGALGWLALAAVAGFPAFASAAERRCGWLENPTPGNFWLRDREGEWTLSIQGGYVAEGYDENMPDMTTAGWVETNVHYGYGCACLVVVVDRASRHVVRLVSATPIPLARCRAGPVAASSVTEAVTEAEAERSMAVDVRTVR